MWDNARDLPEVGKGGKKRHTPLHRKTWWIGRKVLRSDVTDIN